MYQNMAILSSILNLYMFLGEKPSYTETRLRFGLHWNVDVKEKRIIEGYGVFDLPGFFIQAGIDLFKRAHLEQKSNSP